MLDVLPTPTLEQASTGLLQLVHARGVLQGASTSSWRVLMGIATAAGRSTSEIAASRAFEALQAIASAPTGLTNMNILLFVGALQAL